MQTILRGKKALTLNYIVFSLVERYKFCFNSVKKICTTFNRFTGTDLTLYKKRPPSSTIILQTEGDSSDSESDISYCRVGGCWAEKYQ